MYTFKCEVCREILQSRDGEALGKFNTRVYDDHVVYHDAEASGLPPALLRKYPCLAMGLPVLRLSLADALENLVCNAVFMGIFPERSWS